MENNKEMIFELSSWRDKYDRSTVYISNPIKEKIHIWGEDNMAPQFMLDLLNKSAEHNSIVQGAIKQLIGKGFIIPTDKKALKMYNNQPLDSKSVMNNNTFDDVLVKASQDAYLYGCFALECRWGKGHQYITDIKNVDMLKLRIDKNDEGFWYSEDWSNTRKEANKPYEIEALNDTKGASSQILFVKTPTITASVYGAPIYWPIVPYIELSELLLEWKGNRVNNNFTPAVIASFDGNPEPEVLQANADSIKNFYQGTSKASTAMLTVGGMELKNLEPQRFPEDIKEIDEQIDRKIKAGHQVVGTGKLLGLRQPDGGVTFSKDALLEEYEAYQSLVIRPLQKSITDAFNLITKINKVEHIWEIEPFEFYERKPNSTIANDIAEETNIITEDEQSN